MNSTRLLQNQWSYFCSMIREWPSQDISVNLYTLIIWCSCFLGHNFKCWNFDSMNRLTIPLLFDVVVFLAITLNVEILIRWIGSWKDSLIFYKFIPSFFSHSIYDKKNSKVLLFNDTPELKQTNSSFSRSTSKGFVFIHQYIHYCLYKFLCLQNLWLETDFISITACIQTTQIIQCFGVFLFWAI